MPEPRSEPRTERSPEKDSEPRPLVEGDDFYREGPYVVFTEAYHRRRGYCCGSGCRHCPWRDEQSPAPARQDPDSA
ncbi:MAG: DUF5522 domain-containing protein [Acidobacteriaceae bacterium]